MKYINHRVNKISELKTIKAFRGAEIDLRSNVTNKGELLIHHDPWSEGEKFEPWLWEWSKRSDRGTLVLNTKEDGLESSLFDLCECYGISDYLLLDTAFPTLINWTLNKGKSSFMARLSAYEPLRSLDAFRGKLQWLWVDCFHGIPLNLDIFSDAAKDFRLCLVSPELQKQPIESIIRFKEVASYCKAICTKNPEAWIELGFDETSR